MKYMYNNFFYKITLIFCLFLIGCSEDEEPERLFDLSPTQRLSNEISELKELLQSSENGWEFIYYPSKNDFGGFRFYFDFVDDKNVRMTSDFDSDTSIITSEYDVVLGSTVKLSFTTRNDIHKLADGANPPDEEFRGRGYLGQFEFLYYGQDGDDLIFRENRTFENDEKPREFRFKRVSSESVPQFITDSRNIIPALSDNAVKSVFRSMTVSNNGQVKVYDFAVNDNRRFVEANSLDETIKFGLAYTPTGFIISPEFKVGDKLVSEFVYDASKDEFIADLGANNSVVISYQDSPPVPTNDFRIITEVPNTFSFFDAFLGNAVTTTNSFKSLLNQVNTNLSASNIVVNRVDISLNIDPSFPTLSAIVYRGADFDDIVHFVTYELVGGKIIFNDVQWNVAPETVVLLKPLDDFFINPVGLYVKRENFTINFSNAIYTFTSAENSSVRTTTYRL